jgi:presenilin-like A22 family membrane protease
MDLRIPAILVIPLTLSYSLLDEEFGEPTADDTNGDSGADGSETNDADDNDDTDADDNDADDDTDIESDDSTGNDDDTEVDDREAFFIGLGDAVIPGVLVASAAFFSPAPQFGLPLIELNLPALLALVGTMGGLLVLMRMVMEGKPHAGLPLLNGGAIGGYLAGSLLVGVPLAETLGVAGLL